MARAILSAEDVLKRSHAIGQYYGFKPLTALVSARTGIPRSKEGYPEAISLEGLDPTAQVVASFLKQCRDAGVVPELGKPLFIWHTNIAAGRPAPKQAIIQFHAIGVDRAIADAVVIRALYALTQDLFKGSPTIRINTLGDRETRARFARELNNFFKKRAPSIPEDCATCAKKDLFEAAEMLAGKMCGINVPSPTDYLSDQSRKRFEELLEYLEMTETPYELAPELISRGNVWSETCFEMRVPGEKEDESKSVVWGSRYGEFARHFFKTPVAASGAVLRVATVGTKVQPVKPTGRLRFVFVHIGEEAKRESIKLAENLRHARVSLEQTIGIESLTEQMHAVERVNPPYLLIMGRKEALEHSAILRNRETQEETLLSLDNLAERLKSV